MRFKTVPHVLDEIGRESFVNSFHFDYYVNKEDTFFYAIAFCNKLITSWSDDELLNIIISLDPETLLANFRFHIKRDGEELLDEQDLESYIQPVLVTTEKNTSESIHNLVSG